MITWTVVGSVVAIVGVVLLLVGAVRGDRANTEEHAELSREIENVGSDVKDLGESVNADVNGLREEMRGGFEALSKQISERNANEASANGNAEN